MFHGEHRLLEFCRCAEVSSGGGLLQRSTSSNSLWVWGRIHVKRGCVEFGLVRRRQKLYECLERALAGSSLKGTRY